MRMTMKSPQREQTMNATKRSAARAGSVVCSVLAVALTGCRTHVVHEHARTVYVPTPPPVVFAPQAPASQPPPPVVVVAPPEQPPVVVIRSENDFYEPLAAHGRWVVVGSYGRCWIPARVEAGWRPYSNGYWQRTDAGWYWASEEPWAWATYHYGRWDFHAQFGWIWVPHTQWAPAWVCWREGGGYVGWAPLRPSVTIGVSLMSVNYEPAFASRAFVFVEHRRMLEPVRPKTVIVNNTTIINNTVNITNVKVVNKTVINEGPRPEVIERESGRNVQAVPVREFRHREETTVVARERNIPTAPQRKIPPPARTAVQPAPKQAVIPREAHVVEKSPVAPTQPARQLATTARTTLPPTDPGRQARDEKRHESEIMKKITMTPPTVEPTARAEVKPPQAVSPRRDARPVERPPVAAKPATQSVTTDPVREERKRETVIEKKNVAPPPAVEPKPRQEVRPDTRYEAKPPVRVGTVPTAAVRKQTAPPSEKHAEKRLISPKEKSRAAEHAEPNKKMKEAKGAKKKSQEPATPSVAPTRLTH